MNKVNSSEGDENLDFNTNYKLLFELNPMPMWVYDLQDFRFLSVNQAAVNFYGYSQEEFLNLTIKEIRPKDHVPLLEQSVGKVRDGSDHFSTGIYKHLTKSGKAIDVQIWGSYVIFQGRPAELILSNDITASLASERKLTEVNKKLNDSQDLVKIGYWSRKIDQDISEWSSGTYEIYDRDPKTFTPSYENLLAAFHPEDRHLLDIDVMTALQSKKFHDVEHRILTRHGEVRWVFQRLYLEKDQYGNPTSVKGVIQDITEKRKADQKFKAVFDSTSETILIGDNEGNCHDVNEAAVSMFGFSKDELRSLNLSQIIQLPENKDFSQVWNSFLSGKISEGTMLMQRKDGALIYGSFTAKANFLPGLHLCVITDVTERLQQEKRLILSEKRFKALTQEGADLVSIVDCNGVYTFVSDSRYYVLGFTPDEVLGKNVFELIYPDDLPRVADAFRVLTLEKRVQFPPFRVVAKNGSWRWLTSTGTNLLHEEAVKGIVLNSKDITEGVLKNIELKKSNERYQLLMEAANEAVYDWDISTGDIEWGIGFKQIYGYQQCGPHGNLWYDNIHSEDRHRMISQQNEAMRNPKTTSFQSECRYLKANGQVAAVEYRILFLREDGLAVRAIATVKDITELKRNTSQIKVQNDKLNDIAWTHSHILRAPLVRIMGVIDVLQNEDLALVTQQQLLGHIYDSANELDMAIKQVVRKTEENNE